MNLETNADIFLTAFIAPGLSKLRYFPLASEIRISLTSFLLEFGHGS